MIKRSCKQRLIFIYLPVTWTNTITAVESPVITPQEPQQQIRHVKTEEEELNHSKHRSNLLAESCQHVPHVCVHNCVPSPAGELSTLRTFASYHSYHYILYTHVSLYPKNIFKTQIHSFKVSKTTTHHTSFVWFLPVLHELL